MTTPKQEIRRPAGALALLIALLTLSGTSAAARYEVSYTGINLNLTGFIDLDPNPEGLYQGSANFMGSVVDGYEIRVAGDLRGNFIFTPANSVIGFGGRGGDLDWQVTNSSILLTSMVTSTNSNGPPSTEIVSTFDGNQWLRVTDSFIDYRNNANGGNQVTPYTTATVPIAFNTFLPNGGPFVSTLVPLPPAVAMLLPACAALAGYRRRLSASRHH